MSAKHDEVRTDYTFRGFQPIGSFHKMGATRFGMGMAGPGAVGR